MKLKLKFTYLLCFILMIGIIGSGCSKKEENTVDNKNQITNEPTEEENNNSDSTTTESNTDNTSSDATVVSEEVGSNSPWQLLSESTVDTSVYYAGFLNASIGVTVGYSGATSYTEDGGKKWSASANVSACRYGLDLYDENFIVDSGNSGVNLVSKNKGMTWTRLGDFPLKNGTAMNRFISVIDTNNLYVGSLKSLGVSKDGGLKWTEVALPEGCDKVEGMFFMTPEIGYLLETDGTLYKTSDACTTWTTQTIDLGGEKIANSKMPAVAINFQDEEHGMIVYQTKTMKLLCIKTEDGGKTWENVEMPKVSCFTPYLSRDGQYLTLSSQTKKICLYELED